MPVCPSVAVRKLPAAVLARSSWEISQTGRIDCQSFLYLFRIYFVAHVSVACNDYYSVCGVFSIYHYPIFQALKTCFWLSYVHNLNIILVITFFV